MTNKTQTYKYIDEIMTQVQVVASAWSIVGSRFDNGNAIGLFDAEKAILRAMLSAAPDMPSAAARISELEAENARFSSQLAVAVGALEWCVSVNPTIDMTKPDAFRYVGSIENARKALSTIKEMEAT